MWTAAQCPYSHPDKGPNGPEIDNNKKPYTIVLRRPASGSLRLSPSRSYIPPSRASIGSTAVIFSKRLQHLHFPPGFEALPQVLDFVLERLALELQPTGSPRPRATGRGVLALRRPLKAGALRPPAPHPHARPSLHARLLALHRLLARCRAVLHVTHRPPLSLAIALLSTRRRAVVVEGALLGHHLLRPLLQRRLANRCHEWVCPRWSHARVHNDRSRNVTHAHATRGATECRGWRSRAHVLLLLLLLGNKLCLLL